MSLEQLLQRNDVWRGRRGPVFGSDRLSTGFADLDAELPEGGWPRAALIELMPASAGIGELSLLLPSLARLVDDRRWLAWIDPPYVPYAPALAAAGIDLSRVLCVRPRNQAENLWALEQALRAGTCAAVLAWPGRLDAGQTRRLQLAAEAGDGYGFVFLPPEAAASASVAALRLSLEPLPPVAGGRRLGVRLLKCRGGWPGGRVSLNLDEPGVGCSPASQAVAGRA